MFTLILAVIIAIFAASIGFATCAIIMAGTLADIMDNYTPEKK